MAKCQARDCDKDATVAMTTRRPQRDNLLTTIYWDDRAEKVPKKAERLCTEHAVKTIQDLAKVLA